MSQVAIQKAFAKLTVNLHITGVRANGYHLIDAEMVSLDLADTLLFTEGSGIEISGSHAQSVPVGSDNLVAKALRLAGCEAHVAIQKEIPPGGGLGGGSSDAAAVLRWAGFSDLEAAAGLGADVPFCLLGGRARVTGIGEVLEPLSFAERAYTLVLPPFGVNTAAVYREFDERGGSPEGRNHLEVAALAVEPRLAQWRDFLGETTGQEPVLAGSGSTWFVEGAFSEPSSLPSGEARWVVAKTVPAIE